MASVIRIVQPGMRPKWGHRWRVRLAHAVNLRREKLRPALECRVSGCGRPRFCRGWCGRHYQNWRCFGSPEPRRLRHRWTKAEWAFVLFKADSWPLERIARKLGISVLRIRDRANSFGVDLNAGTHTLASAARATGYHPSQLLRAMKALNLRRRRVDRAVGIGAAKSKRYKLTQDELDAACDWLRDEKRGKRKLSAATRAKYRKLGLKLYDRMCRGEVRWGGIEAALAARWKGHVKKGRPHAPPGGPKVEQARRASNVRWARWRAAKGAGK